MLHYYKAADFWHTLCKQYNFSIKTTKAASLHKLCNYLDLYERNEHIVYTNIKYSKELTEIEENHRYIKVYLYMTAKATTSNGFVAGQRLYESFMWFIEREYVEMIEERRIA